MLERRNIHPVQHVSLIQHLEIPTPCLALQEPIIQLLRGHSIPRPSNFDISWEGNAEIFYDPTMYVHTRCLSPFSSSNFSPGCIACHRIMKICHEPVIGEILSVETPTILYPHTVEDILETWPQRREIWDTGFQSNRAELCDSPWVMRVFTNLSVQGEKHILQCSQLFIGDPIFRSNIWRSRHR